MIRPAEELEGVKLPGGWVVTKKVVPRPNATGGLNSTGYLVVRESDGRHGFLKAMDFVEAFNNPLTLVDVLQAMTNAYAFEKSICEKCRRDGVNRVVHAL